MATNYIAYSDSLEVPEADEQKHIDELIALMTRVQVVLNDRYRHAVRFVHSKSHGVVKARLAVDDNLPAELKQGLFSSAKSYPAVIRFSTAPGDIMADSVSTPRGMAVKLFDVTGMEMVPEHAGNTTQDFIFVNSKTFPAPGIKSFLGQQKLIELNLNDPEFIKKTVSNVARLTNTAIGVVGAHSTTLEQLGAPETHILGDTFGSNAVLRYGNYVAKLAFTPLSDNLKALTNKHVGVNFHYSGLRDAVVEFFKTETAVWEVGVQLSTDLEKMPVEDPSKEWDEKVSPYRRVGVLTAGPQDAFSPPLRVFADESLSFSPWHCVAAHRPLGRIMRARHATYVASSSFRHTQNAVARVEPKSFAEVPS